MQEVYYRKPEILLPMELEEVLPQRLWKALCSERFSGAEEIRLHSGRYTGVLVKNSHLLTDILLSEDEMKETLLRMCNGSLYTYHDSISEGYLTLPKGIRVGVCGTAAVEDGKMVGVDRISGLVIRIPRMPQVNVSSLEDLFRSFERERGLLVYSPPGLGKTTLLRAMAMALSSGPFPFSTVVIDSRKELGAFLTAKEHFLDILDGYPKEIGFEIAVRSLGAQVMICDEIGSRRDVNAVLTSANCGVPLIASAHAKSLGDLFSRPAFRLFHERQIFGAYVGLYLDKLGRRRQKVTLWEDANADFQNVRDTDSATCGVPSRKHSYGL